MGFILEELYLEWDDNYENQVMIPQQQLKYLGTQSFKQLSTDEETEKLDMFKFKNFYQCIKNGEYKKVIDGSIFDLHSGQDKWQFTGADSGVTWDDAQKREGADKFTYSIEQCTAPQIRNFISMIQAQCTINNHLAYEYHWMNDWKDIWGEEARKMFGDIRIEIYDTNEHNDGGPLNQPIFAITICHRYDYHRRIWVLPLVHSSGYEDYLSHNVWFNATKLFSLVETQGTHHGGSIFQRGRY
jgi:hypothetical protein